jgi:hypothetical protein
VLPLRSLSCVAMRKTTIRLGDGVYEVIAEEARREGVSMAQFIREAAFGRAWYARGRRGDPAQGAVDAMSALRAVAREEGELNPEH